MAEKRNFKKLSNVEHVRLRTGMWLGQNSSSTFEQHFFRRKGGKFEVTHEEVSDVPAKIKCLDEAVINCVDEYNRNLTLKNISPRDKMSRITITLSDDRKRVTIEDNGRGIPVENATGVFLHLMYGENFDDEVKRDHVAGQNGVGISLVRIVSKYFAVETWNGGKHFGKLFTPSAKFVEALDSLKLDKESRERLMLYFDEHGNIDEAPQINDKQREKLKKVMEASLMTERIKPDLKKKHGVKVTFELDSKNFHNLDVSYNADLLRQYLQDIAMTNPGLKVLFVHKNKEEEFQFKKGLEDVFSQAGEEYYRFFYENKQVGIILESYILTGQNKTLTWVNSNFAAQGGSPVEYIENRLCDEIRKKPAIAAYEKRLNTQSTRNDVRQCFHMYNNWHILNPRFKSQDKSYLINDLNEEVRQAVDKHLDKLIKKLELLEAVKKQMEKRTALKAMDDAERDLRKASRQNIPKLIQCSAAAGTPLRTLFIAEGDSAVAGLRPARDPRIHALFPLRGKPLNVKGMSLARAMQNEEIKNLVAIIGLPMDGGVKSLKELNYDRLSIITDADYDGYAIRSLMMSFFFEYWPSLFQLGFMHYSSAPLYEVEVENPEKKKRIFYCIDDTDYDKLMKKVKLSGSTVIRKKRNKGLGETSKDAMKFAVEHCLVKINLESMKSAAKVQNLWFHKDFAEDRRKTISEYSQLFFQD